MSDFNSRVNELVSSIIERQKDYFEESAEYAEKGWRNQHCFHGVNQWVDYDCACGLCEAGEINEYSSLEEIEEYAKEIVEVEINKEIRQAWEEKERRDDFIETATVRHGMSRESAAEFYDNLRK